ncbi:hypothetical protein [Amycolatopsis pigmentata]|uniref:Zinc-ribbon domain-containing protein n=1 Tax=Amycolatopsis pigmentata TaxID=450801 RepID=A0ABW5FS05_9PSEU
MSTCANCGKAITPAGKRFCQYCGAPAGQKPAKSSPLPIVRLDQLERTPNRRLVVGGAVAAVVVIVTVIVVVLSRPHTTPDSSIGSGGDSGSLSTTTAESSSVSTTDTSSSGDNEPAAVVRDYYTAVNNRDYQTAWQLGGVNLGKSYSVFVDGYATTVKDDLTVLDTYGDTVDVELSVLWSDGTTHEYRGSYTVSNGQITSGTLRKIS